jgi:Calx-beta domain-containing protein/VCBS repeat protein/flagellar hook capping protein FlgD/ASPIC/UnbV protein
MPDPGSRGSMRTIHVALVFACLATATACNPMPAIADSPPIISIDDARIKEGDSGLKSLVFTVRLSAPVSGPVSMGVETFDGTATVADNDYEPLSLQLVFPPFSTAGSFAVSVFGDTRLEGNEWFLVRLADPVGAAFGDSEAFGIITNDERAVFTHSWLGLADYQDGTLSSAWGDFNGDGYPDLPLFMGVPSGPLLEIPGFRDLLAHGNYHGTAWCDYDRDGDLDLVILGYNAGGFELGEKPAATIRPPTPNLLLQNQGDGTFINVAPALGLDIAGNAETAVWGDFDGDGWPDLFAPFYSDRYPFQSFFYHNNGDGTFTDQAAERGVSLPNIQIELRPEGAAAADWDGDGDLDLYCASHFFLNDGNGHFTDIREAVGLPVQFDEGANFVDYDNDGDLDFYLRGFDSPHLYRNDSGHFVEVTEQAGIKDVSYFWGDSWADVDNDGDLDLVQHREGPARLMLNQGDGTFERDPAFETVNVGQELSVWADADRDGDLDVVIGPWGKELLTNHLDASPHFYSSHLRVRVLDAQGHETVHGATVRLRELGGPPGTTQTRVVDGGSGYLGQNEYTVHFGVASAARYALEVVYPSPAGSRVVVDSLVNPFLGPISTGDVANLTLTVYRDGRVERSAQQVAGVGSLESRAGALQLLGVPSPMPARRSVSVPMQMDRPARVELTIHDLRGRLVRRLDPGPLPTGPHAVVWDLTNQRGASVPTGVYFCRLLVDGSPAGVRRLLVVR